MAGINEKLIASEPQVSRSAREERDWGYFEILAKAERFQVKRLMLNPNHSLSYQMHHHRSEHWVVVCGVGQVVMNDEIKFICENESVYIPARMKHKLENVGKIPLVVIEVQSGEYLEEDDIVRFNSIFDKAAMHVFEDLSKVLNE